MDEYFETGKVFLVGAGPGDPELITVKGFNAVRKADVILYDFLVNPGLLINTKPESECILVGKKCGKRTISQQQINRMLIEKAINGQTVVRLKGGDPFIFGRGGEEAEALFKAGIEFQIIPGVTAAVAAAAYAGIPLTHRHYGSSFALVTGYKSDVSNNASPDWKALATGIDTVAIYMGVGKLKEIINNFLKFGRNPDTPVAVIENGTCENQKTVAGLLNNIVERVSLDPIESPAMIIIGEVVRLRKKLKWFEKNADRHHEKKWKVSANIALKAQ